MNVYAVWVNKSGFYSVEAESAEEAEEIVDSRLDDEYFEFEIDSEEVIEVNLVQRITVEDDVEATFDQGEIYNEIVGLADSLDDHVTKEDVVRELRALASRVEGGAY